MAVQLVGNVGKQLILHNESIVIGDIVCPVSCARALKKFNNFPFKADDGLLTRALNKFRKAKDIYNPCWLHLNGVADGVMVVSMVRHQAISRNVAVEGFWVKVSYPGQAIESDICERLSHVTQDCPLQGKYLWCL